MKLSKSQVGRLIEICKRVAALHKNLKGDDRKLFELWQKPTTEEEEARGIFGRPEVRDKLHLKLMSPKYAAYRKQATQALEAAGTKTAMINGVKHFLLHRAAGSGDHAKHPGHVEYLNPVSMTPDLSVAQEFAGEAWGHGSKPHSLWIPEHAISLYAPHAAPDKNLSHHEQEVFVGPGKYPLATPRKR